MLSNTIKYLLKESVGFVLRGFRVHVLIKKLSKNFYFVFNYHSFSKYNNYKVKRGNILETGYRDNFDKQIKFFNKHFEFSYPNEFFRADNKKCSVLVTFDDGYKDNYDIALPVLQKHNAKAIFFIVTALTDTKDMLMHDKIRLLIQMGKINSSYESIPRYMYKGENNYDESSVNYINNAFSEVNINANLMMSTENLIAINKQNFRLGNHTHNHQALSFLNKDQQADEIKICDSILSSITKVSSIAYPNGLYNSDTIAVCKELGYNYGFTIKPGVNDDKENPFELKRIGINVSDSINTIVFKIVMNYIGVSWI